MKKLIPFAITAALALGACGTGDGGGATSSSYTENDASSAILAAKHETKRAKAKNYEWRDTGKLIKKAEAAAKAGDYAKAVKLANKAKTQSTMALAQYEEQKNAGPRE